MLRRSLTYTVTEFFLPLYLSTFVSKTFVAVYNPFVSTLVLIKFCKGASEGHNAIFVLPTERLFLMRVLTFVQNELVPLRLLVALVPLLECTNHRRMVGRLFFGCHGRSAKVFHPH